MKNSKILNILLVFTILLSIFCLPADAASKFVEVYDDADLLSSSEESKLIDFAQEFSNDIDINIFFVTIDDANNKSSMVYADDFYDELTQNQSEYSGILFLVDMDNREVYISTAGNCITWLNDVEIENAIDAGYGYLADGDYYNTFYKMSKSALKTIEHWYESGDTPDDDYLYDDYGNEIDDDYNLFEFLPQAIMLSSVLTIVLVVVLVTLHNRANKKVSAINYIDKNGYKVLNRTKHHVRTYETVSRGYYKSSSSSSSGGGHRSGSSHRSSSGRSHGGGGRKF